MTERPILLSAPMVRAILAGTKTQTRRVMKPQFAADAVPAEMPATDPIGGWVVGGHSGLWWCDAAANPDDARRCPYGQPGDRLWVREAWDFIPEGDPGTPSCAGIRYWADAGYELRTPPSNYNPMLYGKERVRPSIHMPRWASRITLEVTGVRVERLQDISADDARAEGCPDRPVKGAEQSSVDVLAKLWFHDLWAQINGQKSWDANPWVWVVEFKRVG